jgi:hypothetical protein
VKIIEGERMRWLGPLFRMQTQNPCRKLTLHKPEGTRRLDRPAIRWLDSVEAYLKAVGAKNWSWQDMTSNRKRGEGPSWTLTPTEELVILRLVRPITYPQGDDNRVKSIAEIRSGRNKTEMPSKKLILLSQKHFYCTGIEPGYIS